MLVKILVKPPNRLYIPGHALVRFKLRTLYVCVRTCVCACVCVYVCVCWHICCRFDKCFDQKSSQDEVFQNVARPVIDKYVNQYTRDLCFFVFSVG